VGAREISIAACIGVSSLVACSPAVVPTELDRAHYSAAVTYCRSKPGQLVLNEEKSIFCFDGDVKPERDTSSLEQLNSEGLFVVRSRGGLTIEAARLAKMLEDREVTVVVYDYCASACASFFFIASVRTYVMKDSIVAWHYGSRRRTVCEEFGSDYLSIDGTWYPTRKRCYEHTEGISEGFKQLRSTLMPFFTRRVVDPNQYDFFVAPPQSKHIERILEPKLRGTAKNPEEVWMWNPRYYKSVLKTEVFYEKYPASQEEVDALMERLFEKNWEGSAVLYDP
jgi:hypothetical protein